MIVCDYSQVELRLMAEISQDHILKNIYLKGEDAHKRTASIVCGVPVEEVTKEQRQLAKPINFGLIYGLMPKKLVEYAKANYGVAMTPAEARVFYNRYFENYVGVRNWQQKVMAENKPRKVTRTIMGRRRFLDRDTAHNEHYNTPVQGSGADGLKLALWNVYHRLRKYHGKVKMVHMVHDEIVLEADETSDPGITKEAMRELKEGMEEAMAPILKTVPCLAEPEEGDSWAEAK